MRTQTDAKIVVIGGGTGSFSLLSGLKYYTKNLTALVNMADSGGSTGQLRDQLGVLPPGDARQCLVALSQSPKVRDLFNYRFEAGDLQGHSFGNLFLTALEKMTGSFADAVETAAEVLDVRGSVVPATLDNVHLVMTWPDEQVVLDGEATIDTVCFNHDPRQAQLTLKPHARANPAAVQAIEEADMVVLAPGDLYTSLGPALVAEGLAEALEQTNAKVVYVCNLVAKKGHTEGFCVADYASEIERFIGRPVIDTVLYNTHWMQKSPGSQMNEPWVEIDPPSLAQRHYQTIGGDFLAADVPGEINAADPLAAHRNFIRHDGDKVAKQLMELMRGD